jgi:hypothetical protein
VDVAGSMGTMLRGALQKSSPHVKGILFDLPSVIDIAKTKSFYSKVKPTEYKNNFHY